MTPKTKKENSGFIWIALLVLLAALLGTTFTGMQSVGDRQTILTADTLAEATSGWKGVLGTVELDTTRKVEGTGSVKGTVNSGAWGAYFLVYFWDDNMPDWRGWNEATFRIYPVGLSGSEVWFVLGTYELDPEDGQRHWTTFHYQQTYTLDQWNTITIDLYEPDVPGTSASGKSVASPDLEVVSMLEWVYIIHYDTTTTQTLNIDHFEIIYTGIGGPPASINAYVTPATASATVGTARVFTATASGGTPPYSYAWYVNDVVQSGTASSFSYTATSAGTYTVRCDVADSSTPPLTASDSSIFYVTSGTGTATYTLEVDATVGGAVTDATTGEAFEGTFSLNEGSEKQLKALADQNYVFANWVLDGSNSTDNPLTVVMNEDHTLTAHFTYSPGSSGDTNGNTTSDMGDTMLEDLEALPVELLVIGGTVAATITILVVFRKRRRKV